MAKKEDYTSSPISALVDNPLDRKPASPEERQILTDIIRPLRLKLNDRLRQLTQEYFQLQRGYNNIIFKNDTLTKRCEKLSKLVRSATDCTERYKHETEEAKVEALFARRSAEWYLEIATKGTREIKLEKARTKEYHTRYIDALKEAEQAQKRARKLEQQIDLATEKPKVSVYIPAFGCKDYIEEAVNSVLNQTYQRIEVCICIDGDKEVLRKVNQLYTTENKIKWLFQENKGIAGASNTAVRELATGKYLAQLDPDDFIEPTTIEKLVSLVESNHNKLGGAFTDFDFVDEQGKFIQGGYKLGRGFDRNYLREQGNCVKPMRMWRRDLWFLTEGFDESLPAAVDTDMMLKLDAVFEKHGLTFGYLPEVLYHYRWHGHNTSIKKREKQAQSSESARRRTAFKRWQRQGIVSTDFMPQSLDEVIQQIEQRRDISQNIKERFKFQLEQILLNSKGKYSVLDLGCNTGIFTRSLAKLGYFVDGIDLSERKIRVASRDLKRLSTVLAYQVADATNSDLGKKYDLINIAEVLEHVPNYEAVLRKACTHLKKEGKIFISVPYKNAVYDPGHIHQFDKTIMRRLAKNYGLKVKFPKTPDHLKQWLFAVLEP